LKAKPKEKIFQAPNGGKNFSRFTPLIIAIACIAAYYPALSAGFLSDDFNYLYGLDKSAITTGKTAMFYRPLGIVSLQIDTKLWGENAFGYHLTNLILHFAAAWGVAVCAGFLINRQWAGLLAGFIFALHPIHPEAVSWISGRFDVLCGTLLIWSLAAFLYSGRAQKKKSIPWVIASIALFALACLAKEMAFAFPFVIAVSAFVIHPRDDVKTKALMPRLLRTIPFFIAAAILFYVRALVIGGIGGYSGSQSAHVLNMLYYVFIQPFYWLFLPLNRSLFRDAGPVTLWLIGIILVSPLALAALRPAWRIIAFGAASITLSALPTAQIGFIDAQMESSRFLYVPSLFFGIMAASLFTDIRPSLKARRIVGPLVVVYLLTMFLTLSQNNFAWQEAGRVAAGAAGSAVALAEKHKGEWGNRYKKLLMYNIPDAYLGAYVFREGIVTMLRHRTGNMLDGVEISTVIEEIGRFERVGELKQVFDSGTVVWFFNDAGNKFEEIKGEDTIPVTH